VAVQTPFEHEYVADPVIAEFVLAMAWLLPLAAALSVPVHDGLLCRRLTLPQVSVAAAQPATQVALAAADHVPLELLQVKVADPLYDGEPFVSVTELPAADWLVLAEHPAPQLRVVPRHGGVTGMRAAGVQLCAVNVSVPAWQVAVVAPV
jgi:hypothetical protein